MPEPLAQTAPAVPPDTADPLAVIRAATATLAGLVEALDKDPLPIAVQPGQAGETGQATAALPPLADMAATLATSAGGRKTVLTSTRLWTMVGTVAALAAQHPAGLDLPPITQVCMAGVAAIYIAARTIKGGHHREA